MIIREPILAGRAYPGDPRACRAAIEALLSEATRSDIQARPSATSSAAATSPDLSKGSNPSAGVDQALVSPQRRIIGGLVPHDAWTRSGTIAAQVLQRIAAERQPDVIILLGGVHRYRGQEAAMFGSGRWLSPLGGMNIDSRLAERVVGQTSLIIDDPYAHEEEPTLEVQIPFLQRLFPQASLLPIMVPPRATADEVGEAVGRTLLSYRYDAVVVGATNLTTAAVAGSVPKAGGEAASGGLQANDQRFIDLACAMRGSSLVIEALERKNATCSGAAAAATAACATLGAKRGTLLAYTRADVVNEAGASSVASAGYAGIVFS